MTSLTRTNGNGDAFEPANLDQAMGLATMLARSGLMPEALRGKPSDILVILITGHELGLSPMQAIRGIHVIKGKPVVAAEVMVALVQRSPVCKWFRLVESTDLAAKYETLRDGDPKPTPLSFTMEQAKGAGLTGKDNWKNYPAAMLRARASSALCRAVYPDVVMGIYELDEADDLRASEAPEPSQPAVELIPPSPVKRSALDAFMDSQMPPLEAIRAATSLADLEALLPRLRMMADDERAELRAVYAQRLQELQAMAEKPDAAAAKTALVAGEQGRLVP